MGAHKPRGQEEIIHFWHCILYLLVYLSNKDIVKKLCRNNFETSLYRKLYLIYTYTHIYREIYIEIHISL